MISLYGRYQLELARLRAIAARRDFSPDGDREYARQYAITKALYVLCATLGQ